jgi:hypothetical protein
MHKIKGNNNKSAKLSSTLWTGRQREIECHVSHIIKLGKDKYKLIKAENGIHRKKIVVETYGWRQINQTNDTLGSAYKSYILGGNNILNMEIVYSHKFITTERRRARTMDYAGPNVNTKLSSQIIGENSSYFSIPKL